MVHIPIPIIFLQFQIEHYTERVNNATGEAKWHCRKELHNLKQQLIALLN